MRGVCTLGPGLEPPLPTPAFSRSLRVTLWGGVAKWGGAKLPGSSVSLSGGLGGPEACSIPPRPPPRRPRWLGSLTFWLQRNSCSAVPVGPLRSHIRPLVPSGRIGLWRLWSDTRWSASHELPGQGTDLVEASLLSLSVGHCLSFPTSELETIVLLV